MKSLLLLLAGGAIAIGAILVVPDAYTNLLAAASKAFDQYGYNEKARIFNGKADGVDRSLDGMVWGDPTYTNDKLVMKWNEAWDNCNDLGNDDEAACKGAWIDNEWNGALAGGSGEVWHYKIIWVGSAGVQSKYWQEGGYPIWGNYEVLMDQGTYQDNGPVHLINAKSTPNGYGSAKK